MKHLRRLATCLVLFATLPATLAGLLVDVVNPDSAAAAAGMLPGDVILTIAGQEIGNLDDLKRVMGEHQPGERVPVTVRREGGTLELPLTFGERPGGGTSLGVSLKVHVHADGHGTTPNPGTAECLEWIEKT